MPIIHPAVIRQRPSRPGWLGNSGFSLLELTMTLAVGITLAALAVPAVNSSVPYFRARPAVSPLTCGFQHHWSNPVHTLSRDLRWLPLQHQFQQHRKYLPGRQRSGLWRHLRDDFYKCRRSSSFRLASGGPESKRYVAIQAERLCTSDDRHNDFHAVIRLHNQDGNGIELWKCQCHTIKDHAISGDAIADLR